MSWMQEVRDGTAFQRRRKPKPVYDDTWPKVYGPILGALLGVVAGIAIAKWLLF